MGKTAHPEHGLSKDVKSYEVSLLGIRQLVQKLLVMTS